MWAVLGATVRSVELPLSSEAVNDNHRELFRYLQRYVFKGNVIYVAI
jgi:hypothetical protein